MLGFFELLLPLVLLYDLRVTVYLVVIVVGGRGGVAVDSVVAVMVTIAMLCVCVFGYLSL